MDLAFGRGYGGVRQAGSERRKAINEWAREQIPQQLPKHWWVCVPSTLCTYPTIANSCRYRSLCSEKCDWHCSTVRDRSLRFVGPRCHKLDIMIPRYMYIYTTNELYASIPAHWLLTIVGINFGSRAAVIYARVRGVASRTLLHSMHVCTHCECNRVRPS